MQGVSDWLVVAAPTVVVLLALLVVGIVAERRRRTRAETILAERESALHSTKGRLRSLAGRLISAQEAERTRIARDLHDDACQEVAGLAVDVSLLRQQRGDIQGPEAQRMLLLILRRTASLAEHLRLLSHDLHPTVLQHIGLVAALEAHCAEVERQHLLHVRFSADGDVEPASHDVALSLFRIAQEALRNAAQHGKASQVSVSIGRAENDVWMAIADDGVGFDVAAARQNGGLGLVSIEERARLAQGRATIRSSPRDGTTVTVRVPLPDVRSGSNAEEASLDPTDESMKRSHDPPPLLKPAV